MSAYRRIAIAGLLVAALLAAGTLGLHLAEGIDWFDALFESVVTLATAGIAGGQAASAGGKLVTIALLVLGGGVLVYTVGSIVRLTLEGELASFYGVRRMHNRIEGLRDHYIICGFGRVGEEVAAEFGARGVPFVIVDNSAEAAARASKRAYLVLEADATLDETLEAAGVRRARCLVAASNSDANNTYITLSAKTLNATIFVVARASQAENERKLRQAGADRVVSPYSIAGRHIALAAVQPLIENFIPEPESQAARPGADGMILAQVIVEGSSDFAGKTVAEVLATCRSATVLAVRRAAGELAVGPPPSEPLTSGDELILLGPVQELERLGRRTTVRLSRDSADDRD